MKSTVSIVIPAYNISKYIGQLLECISNQTVKPLEVIVVNDGSTDDTVKVCNQYDFVKVITTSNCGVSSARNTGLKEAKGKYVAFLDGDDLISADYLEKLLSADGDIVRCSYREFEGNDKTFHVTDNIVEYEKDQIHSFDYIVWASLIKKDLLDKYNIWFIDGENYAEDAPFCMLLHSLCINFKTVDEVLYFHRVREGSAVSKVQTGKLKPNPPYEGMVEAIKKFRANVDDNSKRDFYDFCILRNIASFLTTQYMFKPYDGAFRKELCNRFKTIINEYCSNAVSNPYLFGDKQENIKSHPLVIRMATKMMVLAYSKNRLYEFSSITSKILRLLNRTKA